MLPKILFIALGLLLAESTFCQCPTSKPITIAGTPGVYLKTTDGKLEENVFIANGYYANGTYPECGNPTTSTFRASFGIAKESGAGVTDVRFKMELMEKNFSTNTWKQVAESGVKERTSPASGIGPEREVILTAPVTCGRSYKGIIKYKVKRYGVWAVDWDKLETNTWNIYECKAPPPPPGLQVSLNKYHGDFNGDGTTDLLYFGEEATAVMLSKNGKFQGFSNWQTAKAGICKFWTVGDFNGDGKDDVLNIYPGEGIKVFLSDGTKFGPGSVWSTADVGAEGFWTVGNFDGDPGHKDDILRTVSGVGVQVLVSTGTSFVSTSPATWTGAGFGTEGFWTVGDFNGDQRDDLLRTQNGTEVLLSTGNSFKAPAMWTIQPFGAVEKSWRVGDFNHDGYADLMRTRFSTPPYDLEILLSNGISAFSPPHTWGRADFNTPMSICGDFDGNHFADVCNMNRQLKFTMFLSLGTMFRPPVIWE